MHSPKFVTHTCLKDEEAEHMFFFFVPVQCWSTWEKCKKNVILILWDLVFHYSGCSDGILCFSIGPISESRKMYNRIRFMSLSSAFGMSLAWTKLSSCQQCQITLGNKEQNSWVQFMQVLHHKLFTTLAETPWEWKAKFFQLMSAKKQRAPQQPALLETLKVLFVKKSKWKRNWFMMLSMYFLL